LTYYYELKREGGGSYTQGVAGENLVARDLVYLNVVGQWVKASALDITNMPVIGIAIGEIPSGQIGRIFLNGFIGYASWSWTPGMDIFAGGVAGSLSQTVVEFTATQRMGVAVTSDLIYFNPGDFTIGSPLPFQVTAGGAAAGILPAQFIHADGSAKGWEIDAADEWAIIYGFLPASVRTVLRINIYGVGLALPGAGNGMLIDFLMNAGAVDQAFATENISVAGKRSNQVNTGIGDVLSWTITAADDADVADLVGYQLFEAKIKYSAAVGSDIATNAVFTSIGIEYI